MNSVRCGIRTTLYGNFRKCGTRFYPVRSGAVRYKVLVMAAKSTDGKPLKIHGILNLCTFNHKTLRNNVLYPNMSGEKEISQNSKIAGNGIPELILSRCKSTIRMLLNDPQVRRID